jgi:hypothetical protein
MTTPDFVRMARDMADEVTKRPGDGIVALAIMSEYLRAAYASGLERAKKAEAEAAVWREQAGQWQQQFDALVSRTAGKNVLRLEAELAAARAALRKSMEYLGLLHQFMCDAHKCDFNEDRTNSWIAYMADKVSKFSHDEKAIVAARAEQGGE